MRKVGLLPHPQLPSGLPSGNDPGGVFAVPWAPSAFQNASYATVPASSPPAADVPQRITAARTGFARLSANGLGAYRPNAIPGWSMPAEAYVPSGGIFEQPIGTPSADVSRVAFRRPR